MTPQSGAVPYRMTDKGVRFLLVTSRRTGRWLFPKGGLMPGLEAWDSAAQEALEAAGVEGVVSCAALGEAELSAKLFGPTTDGLPLVEDARGGTLVLEDIESLPNALQARLLTFINEQGVPAETRIVAIANGSGPESTCEEAPRPEWRRRSAPRPRCSGPRSGG